MTLSLYCGWGGEGGGGWMSSAIHLREHFPKQTPNLLHYSYSQTPLFHSGHIPNSENGTYQLLYIMTLQYLGIAALYPHCGLIRRQEIRKKDGRDDCPMRHFRISERRPDLDPRVAEGDNPEVLIMSATPSNLESRPYLTTDDEYFRVVPY